MSANGTDKIDLGKPQFASHSWLEPIVVLTIMFSSLYVNRYKHFNILGKNRDPVAEREYLKSDVEASSSPVQEENGLKNPHAPKRRVYGWFAISTPNSSRFAHHVHSRILQKFPFLVEMFYWVLNYAFYSCTKAIAQSMSPAGTDVVQLAQDHGIGILDFEHRSAFRFFFPIEESDFQAFFLTGHPGWMTFFNRIYSLVHIPGTVAFLSWYYWAAPDHDRFATARRTMTLGNFSAFIVFCFYPCMPPRLLPDSFNFHDTVRQEHAESVWVGGKMVNQLAAMPSLHFTYAACIGGTFLYHSNVWSMFSGGRRTLRSTLSTAVFVTLAILYPLLVLSVIVATANHYWLDASWAMLSVVVCFLCNKIWLILLPAEDMLLWALRLEKPVPTTGHRLRNSNRQTKNDEAFEESEHLLERYA
ncbi:PAP2 superfamily-domain-containing protein [Aspergillus cavernicola]|uniref:PAP2 superfamily-domain-containing protein n=1 Tax=Aspergillus cavernicola TaxID=176166 RepID=A0ABR4I733_9EURO